MYVPKGAYTVIKDGFTLISEKISELFRVVQQHQREMLIREKARKYHVLAYQDQLTQIPNRRNLEKHWRSLENSTHERYLLLVDVDNFKKVNDTYGHAKGDEVLQFIANYMLEFFQEQNSRNFV